MFKKLSGSFITILFFCAAIIVVLFSCALVDQTVQGDRKSADENIDAFVKWPHEKSDLLPDPVLIFGKLPNGFRYVLMENHKPKDRVSIVFTWMFRQVHCTSQTINRDWLIF